MSETNTWHTQPLHDGERVVALRRRRVRLEVVKGPDRKLRRDLDGDRIVVGTHPRCELPLTDPTVSRQHCEIALAPGGYRVRDLGSTNGTWIDRLRVFDALVTTAARLRVGDTTLRLAPLDDTVDLPLSGDTRFGPLLGRSPAMRRIFDVLARVAPTDSTVLVAGESGTGKELVARAIHDASRRAAGPFVVVDCGALPAGLIESELYGHVRGAFTGASRDRAGAFEAASGGTLFLDELGELPMELQSRLLGAIERRQVQPLGSSELRPVDVRIVAATNRDLRREINRGAFREDLYFRIAVVVVDMPPLRERPEDIPLYVHALLEELSAPGSELTLDAATVARLQQQPWPGNVRELRNTIERAVALGDVDVPVAPGSLDVGAPAVSPAGGVDSRVPFKVAKSQLVDDFERAYVVDLMRRFDDNITQAARGAQIDRVYLLRLLDKYGLRPTRRK